MSPIHKIGTLFQRLERTIRFEKPKSEIQLAEKVWYSQAGQDFWVYGMCFNQKRNGFFLDIGAFDGVYLSNTYLLEKRFGWNGILIEANPDSFGELTKNRSGICINACLDRSSGVVSFYKNSVLGGIIANDCDRHDLID